MIAWRGPEGSRSPTALEASGQLLEMTRVACARSGRGGLAGHLPRGTGVTAAALRDLRGGRTSAMATRRLMRRTAGGSDGQSTTIACRSRGSLTEAFEAGVKGSEPCFPVPLDFFKILGMGVSASASPAELDRAYAARANLDPSLPWSKNAAGARSRVLDLARQALSSRSTRSRARALSPARARTVALPISWVSGAMVLLFETAEYDACVRLGTALLDQSAFSWQNFFGKSDAPGRRLGRSQRRDVALALALSHCELARVHLAEDGAGSRRAGKGQRRVAEGCSHLATALSTLSNHRLMPVLRGEIEATLERLVAPCALDHLNLPLDESHRSTRQQAALVLRDLLLEEGESSGDANVTNDFVQLSLKALTLRETMGFLPWRDTSFESYSWYDSSMLYKAALSGVVLGYLDREPRQVAKGLELVEKLEAEEVEAGRECDLAAERACALVLLGMVDEAVETLEEAEASVGGSIQELERMTEGSGVGSGTTGLPSSGSMMMTFIRMRGGGLEGITAFAEEFLESRMEYYRDTKSLNKTGGSGMTLESYFDDPRVRRFCSTGELGLSRLLDRCTDGARGLASRAKAAVMAGPPDRDLSVLGKAGVAAALALAFGLAGLGGGSKEAGRRPAPPQQQQQQQQQRRVSTGTRARPSPPQRTPAPLTHAEVRWIIKKWQANKSRALGPSYDVKGLRESLAGDLVGEWRDRAAMAKRSGSYWTYELEDVSVSEVRGVGGSGEVATAKARIQESAKLVEKRGGKVRSSYKDPYDVTYTLKRTDAGWRIIGVKI